MVIGQSEDEESINFFFYVNLILVVIDIACLAAVAIRIKGAPILKLLIAIHSFFLFPSLIYYVFPIIGTNFTLLLTVYTLITTLLNYLTIILFSLSLLLALFLFLTDSVRTGDILTLIISVTLPSVLISVTLVASLAEDVAGRG
ncbi:unnamed protein product [Moneuplotes crassus]|uniref:Uncharacterized protein n=1 Tax=Euplotes crassus TaxID=5936 RepID=A0AAD1Y3L8_EUPCR|nr:unnamed protein product [Moneuplotes crassus]